MIETILSGASSPSLVQVANVKRNTKEGEREEKRRGKEREAKKKSKQG
jgi:hypothetical protein